MSVCTFMCIWRWVKKIVVKQEQESSEGVVTEMLPNAMFRIVLNDVKGSEDQEILGYLSGKMRKYRIRVLVGDTVQVILDPYGGKARIIRRQT